MLLQAAGPMEGEHRQFPWALAGIQKEHVSVTFSDAQKRALSTDRGILAETCERAWKQCEGLGMIRTQEAPAERHPGQADETPLWDLDTSHFMLEKVAAQTSVSQDPESPQHSQPIKAGT
jgi:hypothetical protein